MSDVGLKRNQPLFHKYLTPPNGDDLVALRQAIGGSRVSITAKAHAEGGLDKMAQSGVPTKLDLGMPAKSLSDRGVHELKEGRVVGMQIALPKKHPATKLTDNAFATDTKLNQPEAALKQYTCALDINRTRGKDDPMVEMIIRYRMGLAQNHVIKKKRSAGEDASAEITASRGHLARAQELGEQIGIKPAAAYYNLASLEVMLGNKDAALGALEDAVDADAKLMLGLADRDVDMKPLWDMPAFQTLIPMTDKSARNELRT